MNNRMKWLKVSLISATCVLVFAAGMHFYKSQYSTHIEPLNYKRDAAAINKIFEDNRYWLLQEGMDDYSLDYLLINRVSNLSPDQYAKDSVKVLYYKGALAGFITYHKTKFWQGRIRLLAVDQKYRGHGFGLRLMQHALNDLIAQGCTNIFLVTRTNNYPAQKLYRSVGFKDSGVEDGFIKFDYFV